MSRPEVVESSTDGSTHLLRLRYEYIGQLDPIARRVVGGRKLTWIQELRFDTSTAGTLSFSAEADAAAERLGRHHSRRAGRQRTLQPPDRRRLPRPRAPHRRQGRAQHRPRPCPPPRRGSSRGFRRAGRHVARFSSCATHLVGDRDREEHGDRAGRNHHQLRPVVGGDEHDGDRVTTTPTASRQSSPTMKSYQNRPKVPTHFMRSPLASAAWARRRTATSPNDIDDDERDHAEERRVASGPRRRRRPRRSRRCRTT